MPRKDPEAFREKILLAAASVLEVRGAQFTLDHVASSAGVSKGGLLHHFPTKDALLRGLIVALADEFAKLIERELEREPEISPGRWTRAYIRATFKPSEDEEVMVGALAQIVATHPELLEALRESFDFAERHIANDGLPLTRAIAIRLACDGLWFSEITGMVDLQEPLRSDLLEELLGLTGQKPEGATRKAKG
jgi:AcrR family transcriptional regulator